jgi:hypothetical protein
LYHFRKRQLPVANVASRPRSCPPCFLLNLYLLGKFSIIASDVHLSLSLFVAQPSHAVPLVFFGDALDLSSQVLCLGDKIKPALNVENM